MFCISDVETRNIIGYCDKINYIKISEKTGCYISCERENAIGISYDCKPYNLQGQSKIPNAPTIMISYIDSAKELTSVSAKAKQLAKQLAETDEAAIELYEANLLLEEVNAEQDEAIIEIYEMIGELING